MGCAMGDSMPTGSALCPAVRITQSDPATSGASGFENSDGTLSSLAAVLPNISVAVEGAPRTR